jgi:hypothetical protein
VTLQFQKELRNRGCEGDVRYRGRVKLTVTVTIPS